MIKFCGKFCCFHKLYILKLGIQHKHEEINGNSELQCRKRAEVESLTNFPGCENSQPTNLPTVPVDPFDPFDLLFGFSPFFPFVILFNFV